MQYKTWKYNGNARKCNGNVRECNTKLGNAMAMHENAVESLPSWWQSWKMHPDTWKWDHGKLESPKKVGVSEFSFFIKKNNHSLPIWMSQKFENLQFFITFWKWEWVNIFFIKKTHSLPFSKNEWVSFFLLKKLLTTKVNF